MNKVSTQKIPKFNNLKEIIYNTVKLYPENIAFCNKIMNGKSVQYENISYAEFLNDINGFGTKLLEMGYENKRIAIIGKNRYEWVVTHMSNMLGGMVSVPLDKDLQSEELESSLIRSKADLIVFDEKLLEKIEEIKKNNKTDLKDYICMTPQDGYLDVRTLIKDGKKIIENGNCNFINKEIDNDKMSILLFTSGTTSKSKAGMLCQRGIANNIYSMLLVEPIYSTDTNIAFLPMHHIFGSTCMAVMLACGVKTVFPDGLKYVKQNLQEYGVSIFVGVPALIDAMYKNIEKTIEKQKMTKKVKFGKVLTGFLLKFGIDIRRKVFKKIIDGLGGKMRFVISGGAPLDPEKAKGFRSFGIEIVQGYGLTETSPVVAAEDPEHKRLGSIGLPMKDVQVEVVDKDDNGIGELRVKGSIVMLGYYENDEATKEVLKDGWFYTGDLAYIDKEGYIFITGRKKDVIVLKNGKKIFPDEVETLVNRIDGVSESIVYGLSDNPDDKNDLKVALKIVYDKDVVKEIYDEDEEEDIYEIFWHKVKEINKKLPQYKYIKHLDITTEPLIKTTTNKVKRKLEIERIIKDFEKKNK